MVSGEGTSGNTISGNIIGLGANGVLELGNDGSGAAITDGASNNTIGGDTSGEMNIISENHQHGVLVSGAGTMGNTISGNYIGLDASGTMDRGNNTHGILIQDGTQNNVIGGDTGGKRNIISANGSAGVKSTPAQQTRYLAIISAQMPTGQQAWGTPRRVSISQIAKTTSSAVTHLANATLSLAIRRLASIS